MLPEAIALSLGLFAEPIAKQFAIVATHDCDCVTGEDEEPKLELILGREISKEDYDGNLSLAKSTRKLHLEIHRYGRYIELSAITRTSVEKTALLGVLPSAEWILDVDERRILKRWLAARYERVAFPEELVSRLSPVVGHFKKASKNDGVSIIGIYIQFEPEQELEAGSLDPYTFKITVVYDSVKIGARAAAERIADKLESRFVAAFKTLDTITGTHWDGIELQSCTARSDIEFTLQEALSSYVFRLDDVTLRLGGQGRIPPQ